MQDTGRIRSYLLPEASQIVFGSISQAALIDELEHSTQVDRAHVVMLKECGLISVDRAQQLLEAIAHLRKRAFEPLLQLPRPRGTYLMYEDFLIGELGIGTAGFLQLGRSRNDLNAAVFKLRLRAPFIGCLEALMDLQDMVLCQADRCAEMVMPIYTHYRAAVPGTYGHYLAGIASALTRDASALLTLLAILDESPLGAGAAGGTCLPIDPARTATLLGFTHCARNSLDAVASRDLAARVLAAGSILSTTLSRLATDLLLWSTEEFGFIDFPDELVGSSSMMPQKRNPFLLEQIQLLSGGCAGALVTCLEAMNAKPFSNSVVVGAGAAEPVWRALQQLRDCLTLTRLCVQHALPDPVRMEIRAREAFTAATDLANALVAGGQMDFRSAHRLIGHLLSGLKLAGQLTPEEILRRCASDQCPEQEYTPAPVVARARQGGGPAPTAVRACLADLRSGSAKDRARIDQMRARYRAAEVELDEITARQG